MFEKCSWMTRHYIICQTPSELPFFELMQLLWRDFLKCESALKNKWKYLSINCRVVPGFRACILMIYLQGVILQAHCPITGFLTVAGVTLGQPAPWHSSVLIPHFIRHPHIPSITHSSIPIWPLGTSSASHFSNHCHGIALHLTGEHYTQTIRREGHWLYTVACLAKVLFFLLFFTLV